MLISTLNGIIQDVQPGLPTIPDPDGFLLGNMPSQPDNMSYAMSATPCPKSFSVEYIADSGAGRHIGSHRALTDQNIPQSVLKKFTSPASSPVSFETGNGVRLCNQAIGISTPILGSGSELYCMQDSPMACSMGIIVTQRRMPFIWDIDDLPFFC